MMTVKLHEAEAVVEIEVYGQYDKDKLVEALQAMKRFAGTHGHFSEIEIWHGGRPANVFKAMGDAMSALGTGQGSAEFMTKMRRYALVADNPGLMMKLFVSMARLGKAETRIFASHERGSAEAWIKGKLIGA